MFNDHDFIINFSTKDIWFFRLFKISIEWFDHNFNYTLLYWSFFEIKIISNCIA